jgi:hypothetical protein
MSSDEEKVKIIEEEKLRAKEIKTNIYKNLYQMDGLVPLEDMFEMSVNDMNHLIDAIEVQRQINDMKSK